MTYTVKLLTLGSPMIQQMKETLYTKAFSYVVRKNIKSSAVRKNIKSSASYIVLPRET